jgi:hypothetical protein
MSLRITRYETEHFDDVELRSKFTNLQQILMRTHAAQMERLLALASLETVQAEMNRRRAMRQDLTP